MVPAPKEIIQRFNLTKHPEGGYFAEMFRSDDDISSGLPERYEGNHVLYTSIYFMLEGNDFSAFHVLKSDEIWHFYEGTSILLHSIEKNGILKTVRLGRSHESGDVYQYLVKAGSYFCAEVEDKSSYALVGCTVAPGFEYNDFILCSRNDLINLFPQQKDIITKFSRQ